MKTKPEIGMPLSILNCKIGGQSKKELFQKLESNLSFISPWAEDLILRSSWQVSAKERNIQFGIYSIRELGLERGYNKHFPVIDELLDTDLHKRLKISKCYPEDALYLRLFIRDHPLYESTHIIHEPIKDNEGRPSIFSLRKDGSGLRLDSRRAWKDSCFQNKFEEDWWMGNEYFILRKY